MKYATREEMKKAHEKEMNSFPIVFAFSDKQFEEGIREKWGMTNTSKRNLEKICSIGMGGYILKADTEKYLEMLKRFTREEKEFNADFRELVKTIKAEMYNYEYTYSPHDADDYVREAVNHLSDHPRFEEAYAKARREVLKKAGYEGIA